MRRITVAALFCFILYAQSRDEAVIVPPPFRVSTDLVVAPVTVFDRNGSYVSGIQPEHIEFAGICTACHTDLFYSHRAEKGKTGRMMGVAGIRADRDRRGRSR